ncbi:Translation machinery-associated protein 46 [Umbelopsis sp. WA50703]
MPPKKQQNNAKTKKIVEDKTFGMKNKNKSAKVQKYVQQVQQQAASTGKNKLTTEKQKLKEAQDAKKAAELKKKEELLELFKPVQAAQKVPFGTDPKTVLCEFFKAGHCEKGNKCKFSHDLNVARKGVKKDLYTDSRKEKEQDTMDKWDQKKLEEVVLSKAGNPKTTTDIVCKYFLEAIEDNKYGWFWECPNGGLNCKYVHALPPGFVLKSKKDKMEKKQEITLEEFLETERHNLGPNLTPVTLETFTEWKKNRMDKKDAEEAAKRKLKEKQFSAGRSQGMSGRDLFEFNPDLAEDSEEEDYFDLSTYDREEAEKERDRMANERRELETGVSEMSINDEDDASEGQGNSSSS